MEKNFYLSSHGVTHLNTLFIDKDRNPPVYPIEGIPDGVIVEIHYKIKGFQMQRVLIRQNSLSKISKLANASKFLDGSNYNDYMIIHATGRGGMGGEIRKVEIFKNDESHVFYELEKGIIENVPNIEYSYEEDLFTSGLLKLEYMSDEDDEMQLELAEVEKCFPDECVTERVGDRLKAVIMYEGYSQMQNDYKHEDIHLKRNEKVEVIKHGCGEEDPENYLVIKFKGDKTCCIHESYVKPKFYTGSSWDTKTFGFLHSSRPESWTEIKIDGETISSPAELHDDDGVYKHGCFKDQSFLNMLFGGGKKNWDPSLYLEFPGCGSELNKGGVNIVNIYGSHCLNPEEHLSFGNVIPFILGKPGLWAHLFKDELLQGANEEIEHLFFLLKNIDDKLPENQQEIKDIKSKIRMAEKALRAMEQINQQNLGPVLYGVRKRRKKEQYSGPEPEPEPEPAPEPARACLNKKNKKKKQTKLRGKNKKKKQTKRRGKNKKQTRRRKK